MKIIKNSLTYLASPILALLILATFFQLWNCDLSKPVFGYGQDALFHIFIIKTIVSSGWFFQNDFVGYPHISGSFFFQDFPIHADSFNFFIVKIFSYFSSDVFLITNYFFIFTFSLIAFTSFIALRAFNISIVTAIAISLLYAFTPYHLARNVLHLFLSNYAAIPLVIMVALWLATSKIQLLILNEKGRFEFAPNRFFFISFIVAIFVATNGVYYASYSCVIFVFAWFLRGLKKGSFLDCQAFNLVVLGSIILLTLLILYFPSFIYWSNNGFNKEVANRDPSSSEYHALHIIDLFLPIANHYSNYLSKLHLIFDEALVGWERDAENLGILASVGFIFLLLWMFAKSQNSENSFIQKTIKKLSLNEDEKNLISNLAGLNLLVVLFATVGGLVMFVALPFPLLRSHARFCIFIAFFSLFVVGIIFDKIARDRAIAKFLIIAVTILALLDQVGKIDVARRDVMQNNFNIDHDFVAKIEANMPPNSQIFILPVFGFPEEVGDEYESLVFYLHSQNLRWSYPTILARPSDLWQKKISKLDEKNFVAELKKAGFSGIAIDRMHFARKEKEKKNEWQKLRALEKNLDALSREQPITSRDMKFVFFKI